MKPTGPFLSVVPEPGPEDSELERHFAAARELAEPDAQSRARVARALNAALPASAPLPAFGTGNGAPVPGPATVAHWASLWKLVVGAAAIGAVGFGLGITVGHGSAPAASANGAPIAQGSSSGAPVSTDLATAPAPAPTSASASAAAASSRRSTSEPKPAAEPASGADVSPNELAPQRAHAARASASSSTRFDVASRGRSHARAAAEVPATHAAIDFRAALDQLRRAREQLERGHATASLLLLSELDRDAGELLFEEREATRVLALCATGEPRAARDAADRLRQRSPRSIYARRLATSCVADVEASGDGNRDTAASSASGRTAAPTPSSIGAGETR